MAYASDEEACTRLGVVFIPFNSANEYRLRLTVPPSTPLYRIVAELTTHLRRHCGELATPHQIVVTTTSGHLLHLPPSVDGGAPGEDLPLHEVLRQVPDAAAGVRVYSVAMDAFQPQADEGRGPVQRVVVQVQHVVGRERVAAGPLVLRPDDIYPGELLFRAVAEQLRDDDLHERKEDSTPPYTWPQIKPLVWLEWDGLQRNPTIPVVVRHGGVATLYWNFRDVRDGGVREAARHIQAKLTREVVRELPAVDLRPRPGSRTTSAAVAARRQQWREFQRTSEYEESAQRVRSTVQEQSRGKRQFYDSEYVAVSDEAILRAERSRRAAQQYTEQLLAAPCSGNVGERKTLLQVLAKASQGSPMPLLFVDSGEASAPTTDTRHLLGGGSADAQYVLQLENAAGLGDASVQLTNEEAVCELQVALDRDMPHPMLVDVRERLARVYGTSADNVRVTGVFVGSCCFEYTVDQCPDLRALQSRMPQEFAQFKKLKIHPLLVQNGLNVKDFDKKGNKCFKKGQAFQVGPPNRKKTYTQPTGWTRYGLKVLGKYPDDRWLHPFGDDGNWYRAFHGTHFKFLRSEGDIVDRGLKVDGRGQAYAKKAAVGGGTVGKGAYLSPNPAGVPSTTYSGKAQLQVEGEGQVTFQLMLQCAVNPDKVRIPEAKRDYWVVNSPNDVRVYGILLRKV